MTALEELREGVLTRSASGTRKLARRLATELAPDSVLALHGDLGVGKTTFVQGLAEGLGIGESITSPTFTVYAIHKAPHCTLVHLDAYRLESAAEMDPLMIEEYLVSPWCLAIEWPDRIAAWLPPGAIHLDLEITSDGKTRPAHRISLRS